MNCVLLGGFVTAENIPCQGNKIAGEKQAGHFNSLFNGLGSDSDFDLDSDSQLVSFLSYVPHLE